MINLFQHTKDKNEQIIIFAKTNYDNKLPVTDCTSEHLNYIYDKEFKYFLSDNNWDILYNQILNTHLFNKGRTFNLLNNQENVQLSKLKKTVLYNLKELVFDDDSNETAQGRPIKVKQLCDVLKQVITETNIEDFAAVIFHKLEDIVTNALLKNNLNSDFELELAETSLNNSLGMTFFNAYFFSFKDYMLFLNAKDSKKVEIFEEFFTFIFDLYNNNNDKLTSQHYKIIMVELEAKFGINIQNDILVDIFCKKTLIYIIKKLSTDPFTVKYLGIINYFNNQQITSNQLDIIENVLNSSLTINNVLLGSIFVNKLVDSDVFEVFQKTKYKKKDNIGSNDSLGETTLTIRIKQDLIYDFTLNSSNFKPFLTENNLNNTATEYKVYKDNLILNFKLSTINEKIHINKTGKGLFNPQSLFARNKTLSNIQLSIDNCFLDNYLQLLTKLPANWHDSLTKENKEEILTYLSIYGINFEFILNTIEKKYRYIVEALINYCLDIREDTDTTKIITIIEQIKKIETKNIKTQLEDILYKIRAYKLVLIVALQEYILYSNFNYCIMPSYFDFRGRRYFIGLAFNIQSYPFLKAFVKIHEIDINLLTEETFITLRENIIHIINDEKLKIKVAEKMLSLTLYKKNLLKETLNFLYSHIDETKMNYDSFKSFVQQQSTNNLMDIYKKILTVIKKPTKTLMITSYILLEKRKQHSIVNYSNNYSYDMVTSGYQQAALIFPTRDMGITSNLIGNNLFDLYFDIGDENKTYFINCVVLLNKLINPLQPINLASIKAKLALMHESNVDYDHIIKVIFNDEILYNIIIQEKKNILNNQWILFSSDIIYLEKKCLLMDKTTIEIITSILILGRISFLKDILDNNNWLLEKNVIGSRAIMKHIIMIELYGGTRRGREKAYNSFISETCMEIGTVFRNTKDKYMLFYFIENHYQSYKNRKLYGAQKIIKLGKVLAEFEKIIIIKNPNFICKLAPTKFTKFKRIQINSIRIKTKRPPYQLTINRPNFAKFDKLTDSSIIINKRKIITLFPPDFVHSMDAMVPQIALLKIYKLNNFLKNNKLNFNLISIHDNLSLGCTLFYILPEILFDIYKEMLDYNYLNTLKDNFTEKEFELFMDILKVENPFTKDDINNPNMMKYG